METKTRSEQDCRYKLYEVGRENFPGTALYYFASPEIRLVYTDRVPNGKEVTDISRLSPEAREWLVNTIQEITDKWLTEHEDELLSGTGTFIEELRKALKAESEILAAENETAGEKVGKQNGTLRGKLRKLFRVF